MERKRTILVTGASGGIGAAVAQRYLEGGWRVGLMARRAEALREGGTGSPGCGCSAR